MTATAEEGAVVVTEGGNSTGGKRRPKCGRRCCLVTIVILSIIILILLILLLVLCFRSGPKDCITAECLNAASIMKKRLNESVAPCDDFYQFACGGYVAENVLSPNEVQRNVVSFMRKTVAQRVKDIILSTAPAKDPNVNKLLTKARKVYKNCLESEKFGPSRTSLAKVFATVGPLPVLHAARFKALDNAGFMALLLNISTLGVNLLFTAKPEFDIYNTTRYRMMLSDVDQSKYLMRRYEFFGDKAASVQKREAYTKFVKQILERVYSDSGFPTERVDAKALVKLQAEIAKLTQTMQQRRNDSSYKQMTVQELVDAKKPWNLFDWKAYFSAVGEFTGKQAYFSNTQLGLTIVGFDYFKEVDDLVGRDEGKRRLLGQIATFELVIYYIEHLGFDYRSIQDTFNAESGTPTKTFSRERICSDFVLTLYQSTIGRVYSDKYFDQSAKALANDMITQIRQAFKLALDDNEWLDDETRDLTKEKLDWIVQRLGFDPILLKPETFEKDSTPSFEDFVASLIKSKISIAKAAFSMISSTTNRERFSKSPVLVNAMYSRDLNAIEFPMAILSAPVFDKNYLSAMNFGAMGSVIGHEIFHAFDSKGRKRDKLGNMREWWPPAIRRKFISLIKCIVDQYAAYKTPYGDKLDTNQYLAENIADQAGLKYAYKAYKKAVADGLASSKTLPGLSYSGDQLFFINFAQVYCTSVSKRYWTYKIRASLHAPSQFRVLGVLSSSPFFRQAFSCKQSDRMTGKECPIW